MSRRRLPQVPLNQSTSTQARLFQGRAFLCSFDLSKGTFNNDKHSALTRNLHFCSPCVKFSLTTRKRVLTPRSMLGRGCSFFWPYGLQRPQVATGIARIDAQPSASSSKPFWAVWRTLSGKALSSVRSAEADRILERIAI